MKALTPAQTQSVSMGITWRYPPEPLPQFDAPDPDFYDRYQDPSTQPSAPNIVPTHFIPSIAPNRPEAAPDTTDVDLAQFLGWMDCGGD